MTFGAVFPRVMRPAFGPGLASATAASWWLSGGATGAVAVYQPKGAASYAASKVNLANPGVYDAADGAAYPTWDAATGWTFGGTNQVLASGITPGATGWSLLIRLSTVGPGGAGAGRAIDNNDVGFGIMPNGGTTCWYVNGVTLSVAPPVTSSAVVGFAAKTAYRDGSSVGTIVAGSAPALPIYIGNNSALSRGMNGDIVAMAIYNIELTAPQVAAISTAMAAL